MITYCEFQLEACSQLLLQMYLVYVRYWNIRIASRDQQISILLSSISIVSTCTRQSDSRSVGNTFHSCKQRRARDIPVPGYPEIIPGLKNPTTKNPGILISEISRDKKSRDFCYLKIPGFFNKIPGYPVGFNFGFFTHFID